MGIVMTSRDIISHTQRNGILAIIKFTYCQSGTFISV